MAGARCSSAVRSTRRPRNGRVATRGRSRCRSCTSRDAPSARRRTRARGVRTARGAGCAGRPHRGLHRPRAAQQHDHAVQSQPRSRRGHDLDGVRLPDHGFARPHHAPHGGGPGFDVAVGRRLDSGVSAPHDHRAARAPDGAPAGDAARGSQGRRVLGAADHLGQGRQAGGNRRAGHERRAGGAHDDRQHQHRYGLSQGSGHDRRHPVAARGARRARFADRVEPPRAPGQRGVRRDGARRAGRFDRCREGRVPGTDRRLLHDGSAVHDRRRSAAARPLSLPVRAHHGPRGPRSARGVESAWGTRFRRRPHPMTRLAVALLALFALTATAPRASAQFNNASIAATAELVTVGMTITTLSNLNFGSVPKGVATTVLPSAAGAGEWQVDGNPNAFAAVTFTLPTVLTNIQALPGSTMPITFTATSAIWHRRTNNAAARPGFDPNLRTTGRLMPPGTPTLYIWIGGTVNPAANVKPGIYQGTIIVTLIY